MMLHQLRAWFRRRHKLRAWLKHRHISDQQDAITPTPSVVQRKHIPKQQDAVTSAPSTVQRRPTHPASDPKVPPPPYKSLGPIPKVPPPSYNSLSPTPRILTPSAQHNPASDPEVPSPPSNSLSPTPRALGPLAQRDPASDPKVPPPPHDSLGPIPCVLGPLAQRDPAIAASYYASTSATAITARAIAESPDAASAMDKALRRIHTVVPDIIRSHGVEHDHRLVNFIWDGAISVSADTARAISQEPNPSYAIKRARIEEASLRDCCTDAIILRACDVAGIPVRHKAATYPETHSKV